jgi:hypothetical protein
MEIDQRMGRQAVWSEVAKPTKRAQSLLNSLGRVTESHTSRMSNQCGLH